MKTREEVKKKIAGIIERYIVEKYDRTLEMNYDADIIKENPYIVMASQILTISELAIVDREAKWESSHTTVFDEWRTPDEAYEQARGDAKRQGWVKEIK